MRAGIVPSGFHEVVSGEHVVPEGLGSLSALRADGREAKFLEEDGGGFAGLVIAFYLPARGEDASSGNFEPNAAADDAGRADFAAGGAIGMGQALRTAMAMIIAEELEADSNMYESAGGQRKRNMETWSPVGSASTRVSYDPLQGGSGGTRDVDCGGGEEMESGRGGMRGAGRRRSSASSEGTLSYGELATAAAALPVRERAYGEGSEEFPRDWDERAARRWAADCGGSGEIWDRHEIAGDVVRGGGEVPVFWREGEEV